METKEMLRRLKELEMEKQEIVCRLANEVTKQPAVMEALNCGLVKLGFPAPRGFHKFLKER
jgi:hypothetical protein